MKKLLEIENSFINLLTKLAWWVDSTLERGTIWLSVMFAIIPPAILGVVGGLAAIDKIIEICSSVLIGVIVSLIILPLLFSLAYLFLWGATTIFLADVYQGGKLFKNTKEAPNPNRYTFWIYICRGYVLGIPAVNLATGVSIFITIFMLFVYAPAFYLLCVDPIPPQEKEKRKAEKEIKKAILQPSC